MCVWWQARSEKRRARCERAAAARRKKKYREPCGVWCGEAREIGFVSAPESLFVLRVVRVCLCRYISPHPRPERSFGIYLLERRVDNGARLHNSACSKQRASKEANNRITISNHTTKHQERLALLER